MVSGMYHGFLLTAFIVGVSAQTTGTKTTIILSGAGTTNPQNYFRTVMEYLTVESKLSTRAVYRAVGSSTGYKEFIGAGKDAILENDKFVDKNKQPITSPKFTPLNDFGAGDIPIAKSYYAAAKANDADRKIMQIPLFLGAIAIFYNNDKGKVSKLNLDGCVLVGIFSGKITKWNDKKITDLNAGATLPTGNIVVVHRRYGSSSTSGTTHYLQEVGKECAGGKWPDKMNGGKNVGSTVGTDGKWFADDSDGTDVAAQGSSGVLAKLRETPGSIGYLDAGHGRNQDGLGEVSLKNAAGAYVISSDLAKNQGLENVAAYAVAKNVFNSDYTADWSDVALLNLGGDVSYNETKRKTFWPITMVTYLYVNPDQSTSDPEWYGFWKFFVDYVTTSTEGQDLATHAEFGFTKLPQAVIDKNKAQIQAHFKAPPGAKIWTQELAGKTQAYVGAGDYVISGKRKSNAFAKRSALAAALGKNFGTKDTVVDVGLITELKNLETRVKSVESGNGSRETIILSGAGTTNPQNYFRTVMEYLTVESKLPTRAVYRAVGSSTGYKEFIGAGKDATLTNDKFVGNDNKPITSPKFTPLNDFGAGDIPIAKSYYAAAKANDPNRKIMQIPLFLGAIAIFYNNDKGKVSKLNLDGCVLVGIFSGKITKWNDKKITDLNAGATLPTGNIVVVHRRYGSSSTSGTTHYLQEVGKACVGGKWPDTMNGGKNVGSTVGTDGKWFADDSDGTDVAAQGSSGVLAKLRETPGSIGYLDAGHGRNQDGLGEVSLKNAAGAYVISSDLAKNQGLENVAAYAVAKNVFNSDYTADWSDVALLNLGGDVSYNEAKRKTFWPITMVTYLYVNPDQSTSDPEWYGFWKFFVDYITTSAEGQDLATHAEFGFTKLPQAVIDKNKAQIEKHFKAPSGAKIFTQEFADKTQAYVGAGDYVISGKRKSNAFAKRSALAAALGKNFGTKDTVVDVGLITELKNLATRVKSVEGLQGTITTLQQEVSKLTSTVNTLQQQLTKLTSQKMGQTIILSGAGTTNPQNYFRTVMEYLTVESKLPTRAVYRAVGSSTGYKEFIGAGADATLTNDKFVGKDNKPITSPKFTPLNDFGAGDIPIAKSYYAAAKANDPNRKIMQIPLFLGAIGIFYNDDKGNIKKLTLDGCVLVQIFSGKIKDWSDTRIQSANSGSTPSGKITVVHRRKGSSSTSGTTHYLQQVANDLNCPVKWPDTMNGGNSVGSTVGNKDTGKWFADGSDVAAQGSSGVLAKLRETKGSIGYLDAGHGRNQDGLGEVSLKNAADVYVLSSDLAKNKGLENVAAYAVAKNVFKSDYTADWSDVALLNLGGDKTWDGPKRETFWPITMVTYLYVNPDQSKSDPEWYGFWKFFIDYITTSAEGQDLATHAEFGFTKLPKEVLDNNKAQIKLHFKAPPGAKIWTQEFADKTQAYAGAGDYVISGKRKSNAFAKRSALAEALGKNFGTRDTVVDVGLITKLSDLTTSVQGNTNKQSADVKDLLARIAALKDSLKEITKDVDENTKTIEKQTLGVSHGVHARTFDFETTLALLLTTAAMWTALMR